LAKSALETKMMNQTNGTSRRESVDGNGLKIGGNENGGEDLGKLEERFQEALQVFKNCIKHF
jgi:hypothetical protein